MSDLLLPSFVNRKCDSHGCRSSALWMVNAAFACELHLGELAAAVRAELADSSVELVLRQVAYVEVQR